MNRFNAADDVIRSASMGVGPPVQMAAVTPAECKRLSEVEVRGVEDTLAAYKEYQRDYVKRDDDGAPESDTGVRP